MKALIIIESKYSTYTLIEDNSGRFIKYRIYSSLSDITLYAGKDLNRAKKMLKDLSV